MNEQINKKFDVPQGFDLCITHVFYKGIERKNFYNGKDLLGRTVVKQRIYNKDVIEIHAMERDKNTGEMWVKIDHKHGSNYCKMIFKKTVL